MDAIKEAMIRDDDGLSAKTNSPLTPYGERQMSVIRLMRASSCFGHETCPIPPCACAQSLIDAIAKDAEPENRRLRAALEACAADYISNPCTVIEGHSILSVEFRRRMEIAARALETK